MFCPRCGNQINEGLKFCKSCGLPVAQVSNYVATGGTGQLSQIPPPSQMLPEKPEYLTPKQQMIVTILLLVFSIPALGVLSEILDFDGSIVGLASVLMPLGIVWAVIHYKAQMRRREYERQQALAMTPQMPQTPPQMAPPVYQPMLTPPPTNPLAQSGRGSVIEDDTRKLPETRNR